MPWLAVALIISSLILLFLAQKLISDQLQSRHQQIVESFHESVEENTKSLFQQVINISKNELIINSLVDLEGRDNYISLFIRSFSLSGVNQSYLAVTDFSGEIITQNGFSVDTDFLEKNDWKVTTLEKGLLTSHLDRHGLFISVPIELTYSTEGAVISFIPLSELQLINSFNNIDGALAYLDQNGTILYSSNNQLLPYGEKYSADRLAGWFILDSPLESGFRIISTELDENNFDKYYLVIVFMIVAIAVAIICTSISVVLSSRLVSKSLKQFVNSLKNNKNSDEFFNDFEDSNSPVELVNIHRKFNVIIQDLFEARLLKSNIQNILNSLDEYLVVFNITGHIRMANYAFDGLIEKIDSVDGEKNPNYFSKIIPPEYQEESLNIDESMDDFEVSYAINKKYNEYCIIHWSRSIYYSDEGVFEGVIFIGADVTRARRTEKDLYLKNLAIEEASNGIVISDALQDDMPLVYANQAFIEMTGYTYDEIIGKNCRFLQGEKTDKAAIKRIDNAVKENNRITETLLNYRSDGSEFYNHLMLTPIRDLEDNVTHYLGVQLDVTERVKTDNELLEAKAKAEESAEMKSQFLASMSHEIRTPMNGVLGMLGLLRRTKLNDQQNHYASLANSSAESLLKLINDILDFSKVEAGKMELEIIDFNLPDMLSDFAEAMAQRAQEKNLEFILDLSEVNYTFVKGDPGRIRQILTNLMGNAIKFTSEGEVSIAVSLTEGGGDRLTFNCIIRDTGIGIPKEKVANLFDSFSQVDASTTRKYGGTGLGLAIVKQLCELMEGDVNVFSSPGFGSDFTFTIQLHKSENSSRIYPPADIHGSHILLVDDNSTNRAAISAQLKCLGAKVTEAMDADSALRALELHSTQAIVLAFIDMQMPGFDGEELGKKIRSESRFDDIRLVIMTPLKLRRNMAHFKSLGFSAAFSKPATINDLFLGISTLKDDSILAEKSQVPSVNESDDIVEGVETITITKEQGNSTHCRLLLVEDNLINQEVALGILECLGYTADIAENGVEALQALNDAPEEAAYDLILMDCQMPEMDGYEATRAIRAGQTPNPNIPIVAMTANAMKGDREKCLTAGMDDYLSKPLEPETLNACLAQWLQRKAHVPTKLLENDDTVNSVNQQVWDEEGFMKRIMTNEGIATKLINLFKSDTPKTISELEAAILQNKTEEAGLLAHKLKGSVSNLGGVELADLAYKIEKAGKEKDLNEVKKLWPDVNPQYNKLLNEISSRQQ